MRLGVISDLHADASALERAFEVLERRGADKVVCLGDTVEKGEDGDRVVDALCAHAWRPWRSGPRRALRQDWRARSREVGRVRVVEAPHTIVTGRGADGAPVLREVVRRSAAIVSTQGPAFRALAQAWGAEALRMLWAPARVPDELAERAALGWAGEDARAAWEATRGCVRDRAVEAWAEAAMREVARSYATPVR